MFIVGKQCKFGAGISCETHSRRLHLRPGWPCCERGCEGAGSGSSGGLVVEDGEGYVDVFQMGYLC